MAEFWWLAPATVGAGALGVLGARGIRASRGMRLAYDAAALDLRKAQQDAVRARSSAKLARAEYARIAAERTASRAATADLTAAKHALREADRAASSAAATVRSHRLRLKAAKAELSGRGADGVPPLTKLQAQHDALVARWMEYETDPAKAIAFPAMSDAREPATAAFLAASRVANEARPYADAKVTPTDFAHYRDAVAALERALIVAERAAWAKAGVQHPASRSALQEAADDMIARSAESLGHAVDSARAAFASWVERDRARRSRDER